MRQIFLLAPLPIAEGIFEWGQKVNRIKEMEEFRLI